MCAKSLQSCLTLSGSADCSPPGSSVPGASPGENTGVARPSSRGSSRPGDQTQGSVSLPLVPRGKPRPQPALRAISMTEGVVINVLWELTAAWGQQQ